MLHVVERGDLAADHPAHDLIGRGLRPRGRGDELAVAEHGHAVGQGEDFVHFVADVEHRGAGFPQVGDDAKEPRDLRVGQGRGGLIHDHDLGVEGECLGDLDHLLIADPQVGEPGLGRDGRAQPFEQAFRPSRHRTIIEPAEPSSPGLFAAQENVVGDRELGNQVELLVDDPDAGVFGLARAREPDRPAVEMDLAFKIGDGPGQDLHERALARAVLAANGVDLAGARGEARRPGARDAAKALGDMPHLEPGHRWGRCGFKMSRGLAHDWAGPRGARQQ